MKQFSLRSNLINRIYEQTSRRILPSPPAKPEDGLEYWQQQIFLYVILCMVVLGLGAYISGALQFARANNWTMVILDTGFYLFAFLTAFSKKVNLQIRFYEILFLFFLVGIALTVTTGTAGSGPIWLFSFAILAGIFFSVKGAIIATVINTLSLIIISIIAENQPDAIPAISQMDFGAYATIIINFLLLNAMVSILISVLTNGLSETLAREIESSNSLAKEITKHKHTESQLKISEERLAFALKAVNDGLWDWDLSTNEVYYSPRWETMLGYEPGETERNVNAWQDLIHQEDAHETICILQRHLNGETSNYETEHRLKTKTGEWLWVLDRGTIVSRDPSGKPIRMTGTHTDISERKLIEAELKTERTNLARKVAEQTAEVRAVNKELLQASKMKDNFLAAMSHELRTPLNAILGFSEALMEGIYGPLNQGQYNSISRIQDGGNHLLYLINDILDISKLQAEETKLNYESLSIQKFVDECFSFIDRTAAAKQIATIRNIDPLVNSFMADERRFKQILINLLNNAVKFTPQGGSIGLDIKGRPNENLLTFTVWDTGIGIHEDDMPRLFKPFTQLDNSLSRNYDGTGLGLALVRNLTELHQGQIKVESEPDKGSRFTITLPWEIEDNNLYREEINTDTNLMNTFKTALIIEDSDILADLLVRYLKELGISANILSQGKECSSDIIAERRPDVIILDIILPETSGWDILKHLKENPITANIPVIITTIVGEPEKGLALGASEYLQKPISRSALAQALHRVANSQPHLQDEPPSQEEQNNNLILLAEDNLSNAETILDYLKINGYTTIWAKNGLEAVKLAKQANPCLILMDMQMPELDGLEAIRLIRKDSKFETIPIIALTALAMPGDKQRFLNAGANAYLSKPIRLKNLRQVIANLLNK